MLFPTIDFAIFFCVVFLGHWLLNPFPKPWKIFMIIASYVFYAWWEIHTPWIWGSHFVWLLVSSTVIAQTGGLAVHHAKTERARRLALGIAVGADLSLLLWFKYYGFLALNLTNAFHSIGLGQPLPLLQIVLPIGISFFTFMGISYIVDVYRRQLVPAAWLDFFTYLSFFPHLVAGPIVRGRELLPQIRKRRNPRRVDVGRAAYLIWAGLFKKVVISSFLATAIVDPVFADPHRYSSWEILFAIYAYAVQIFADFSGYTDIAIGVALLLGFEFPENFANPYTATSLQDFWRRWHITLSRWLRDYLYIPLGGNRRGRVRTYVNLMLTMLLGGLWHGASWTFVVWGGIHGLGLAAGHYRREDRKARGLEPEPPSNPARRVWQRLLTFHLVCLAWVFFRSTTFSSAVSMLSRLFTAGGKPTLVTPLVVVAIFVGIAIQYVSAERVERIQSGLSRLRPVAMGTVLGLLLFLITSLGPQGVAPFIYYRF